MTDLELADARIKAMGLVIDALIAVLKQSDPGLAMHLVSNSTINDWYLIRVGAK